MNSRENEGISSPYQITVRFGNEILQAGFTAVPNLVLDHYGTLGITSAEMMFVIHIWQYWWTEKNPYPSLQAIADRMATSRRQVRRYTESLKEKGLLRVNERRQPGLGQVSSEYDFAPLIEQVLHLASKENGARTEMTSPPRTEMTEGARTILTEAPRTEMTPEEYSGEKHTQREEDPSKFEIRKASPNDLEWERTPPQHTPQSQSGVKRHIRNGSGSGQAEGEKAARPARHSNGSDLPRGVATPAEILANRLGDVPQPHIARRGRPVGSADEREQLRAYLADFSRELHDAAPLSSTITRVLRLFREAGVPRERWGDVLYQARAVTQEHSAQITTPAGDGHARGTRNKVPYFIAVVQSLISPRPSGDTVPEAATPTPPSRARRSG
jgi:Helix-turn-helix domain